MAGITEAGYIKDKDCTRDTPVFYGRPERPVYGQGVPIRPRVLGRTDTEHKRKIYLEQLFPLEDYDRIVVLLSGGKDSVACYCKLRELGVPKEKIEFWHHDIDGKHPSRRMDWRCTGNYVRALAEAEGVPLRVSWRRKGFFGELYRMGASEPVEWEEPGTGAIRQCRVSKSYALCEKIRQETGENQEEQLRAFGCRMKFPMKTGDLGERWCSAYLKIMVADMVMINLDRLRELVQPGQEEQAGRGQAVRKGGKQRQESRVLMVSGERRGESAGRSKYNEMETRRTNAEKRARRTVHQWRPVIDYSEKDVWEVLKRHRITLHPCYRAGWNRCSCAMCIFSTPKLFAGIRELYPEEYALLKRDEEILGFTLDNRCDLDSFVGGCQVLRVPWRSGSHPQPPYRGVWHIGGIYSKGEWSCPAGAFHGAEGGPC